MPPADLGACEWFAWDLRRSNLVVRERLDAVLTEFMAQHPGAEPPVLADFLVAKGLLTPFQAGRLLQGKTEGFVLGAYTLVDALGAGSMGAVYKAKSKNDGRHYAVKILPRRSMWNMRLARRKVHAFAAIDHPAVVPFADAGTAGGMHYLVWPLIEGESLDQRVERQGKLPAAQTADAGAQAAEGLDACHQQKLFHGLLKPSNLMVEADGRLRILDLGIGSLLAETADESLVDTMSTANSISSGLDCASPESIMDPTKMAPVGDQYGLGCVLYYCLAGQFPFAGGTAVEKMTRHQMKQPAPLKELAPDAPDGLIAVIDRLMKKAPEERYHDCAAAAQALRAFAAPALRPAKKAAAVAPAAETRTDNASAVVTPSAPIPLLPPVPLQRTAPAPARRPARGDKGRLGTLGVVLRTAGFAIALCVGCIALCLLFIAWLTYLF